MNGLVFVFAFFAKLLFIKNWEPYRKLTGMAFRVPFPDVSVVDLTVKLAKEVRVYVLEGFRFFVG